jgi:hypothetical protein
VKAFQDLADAWQALVLSVARALRVPQLFDWLVTALSPRIR